MPAVIRDRQDLVALFVNNAVSNGFDVRVINQERLVREIAQVLEEKGINRVGIAGELSELLEDLNRACGGKPLKFYTSSDLDTMFDLDAGIVNVRLLVASTGSVILMGEEQELLSLVPPVSIMLADANSITADIAEAMIRLNVKQVISDYPGIIICSGPSQTADIEKTLVRGAHGPAEVILFVVRS